MLKEFLFEEDGLGTVEMLLILAGLVSVAIIFKKQLLGFIKPTTKAIFDGASKDAVLDTTPQ